MIPLFSVSQIREADNFAINSLKIPSLMLMENASISIFNFLKNDIFIDLIPGNVGIICGKGNNGGDGFAVARHLICNGIKTTVIYVGEKDELSEDAQINLNLLENILTGFATNSKIIKYKSNKDLKNLRDCDFIIDALLGTGTKGEINSPYKEIIEELNSISSLKIAIDVPSGLNPETGFGKTIFKADFTITLAELKKGLFINSGKINSGKVVKGYIGIPGEYFENLDVEEYFIEPEDALQNLPEKNIDLNKYTAGKILIIAGSDQMPGAAMLSAEAALKSGAGAVYLSVPNSVKQIVNSKIMEVIVVPYGDENSSYLNLEDLDSLKDKIEKMDVLVLGPGLGRNKGTIDTVRNVLKSYSNKKMILDADAIFAIGKNEFMNFDLKNCILTPHLGEFANLIDVETEEIKKDILKYGKDFCKKTNTHLVLKGAPTIIFNPEGEALINSTGNQGMAKFGTGDALTGIIGSFVAQTGNLEQSAVAGVYLHSLSADLLLNEFTEFGYTASDIIAGLPKAINFLRGSIV